MFGAASHNSNDFRRDRIVLSAAPHPVQFSSAHHPVQCSSIVQWWSRGPRDRSFSGGAICCESKKYNTKIIIIFVCSGNSLVISCISAGKSGNWDNNNSLIALGIPPHHHKHRRPSNDDYPVNSATPAAATNTHNRSIGLVNLCNNRV